ncbi:hypothetical protein Hte_005794 [Hypoxylon texense]
MENLGPQLRDDILKGYPSGTIAIVGMACKLPGADSTEDFWKLLDSGLSTATEPPKGRFPTHEHKRSTDKSVYYGHFLDDVASFDHRFFKKSPREAASMDPAQRLLMECAYHALESSGYFRPGKRHLDVGCFAGVCTSDYVENVASHPANAFSALGTLRAFLSGRISHFFGFTGPSITFDTACSSSATAIDAACKAIRCGDCTTALAGGVSVITSPHLYQNLAAASFLSPTGATKPFDAKADGYCRGEGVGFVVLKGLSQALADGDNIHGTVLAISVKQSSNQVPITVPHSPSQVGLYARLFESAQITAEDVSYLEAHGTGTSIGDPQEFEAIRVIFNASSARNAPLLFSSVKGNIGHTEGASGVAGLIKILLMMQKRAITRQANYSQPNPKIQLIPGGLEIPTETVPWKSEPLIACLSNHGAAGSITGIVVKEPPRETVQPTRHRHLSKYPVLVSGNSPKSLAANCTSLRKYIADVDHPLSAHKFADIAFNLSYRQNRDLPMIFTSALSSLSQLDTQLQIVASNPDTHVNPKSKPAVLLFSGQNSLYIGLDKATYDGIGILRAHLDECNRILKILGHHGIYPDIFSPTPINNIVSLQIIQFCLQYSCARSWIDCGLKVDCIIGHSFGQLTTLVVAGVLSLGDGLKLVHGRAALIEAKWGPERGSMIALDSDRQSTLSIVSSVKEVYPRSELEVACYNGPRSHVLVGSATEIDLVFQVTQNSTATKVLDVTHGFHSRFCQPLLDDLKDIAKDLSYHKPKIHIEMCSSGDSPDAITPESIVYHTRQPVYFEEAIQRIEGKYGPCTWIEAGSNSSIINLARRCIFDIGGHGHAFYPVNLSNGNCMDALTDITVRLWENGHHVQFWPFHQIQRRDYASLNLPPYQFEKASHWLEFNLTKLDRNPEQAPLLTQSEPEPVLVTFVGFEDDAQRDAVFNVDARCDEWKTLVEGHRTLQTPLCPASLYIEVALKGLRQLADIKNVPLTASARVENLEMLLPLGETHEKAIALCFTRSGSEGFTWSFTFKTQDRRAASSRQSATHAVGKATLTSTRDEAVASTLDRFGRLLQKAKLAENTARREVDAVHGSLIYKMFSRVVQYEPFYQGLRMVAADEEVISSQIRLPTPQPVELGKLLYNPVAIDNFLQVPGFYLNNLYTCPSNAIYICAHIDNIQLSEGFNNNQCGPWDLTSMSTLIRKKVYQSDLFVTDPVSNKVVCVAFGVRFNRIPMCTFTKTLARDDEELDTSVDPGSTPGSVYQSTHSMSAEGKPSSEGLENSPPELLSLIGYSTGVNSVSTGLSVLRTPSNCQAKVEDDEVEMKLREILIRITDLPASKLQEDGLLQDLGIDSLMAVEIISEVAEVFRVSIPQNDIQGLRSLGSLRDYIHTRRGGVELNCGTRLTKPALRPADSNPTHISQTFDSQRRSSTPHLNSTSAQWETSVSRLTSIVQDHLGCSIEELQDDTTLVNLGLDSLVGAEVLADIKETFSATIDLSLLLADCSFGKLADIVLKVNEPRIVAQSHKEIFSVPYFGASNNPVGVRADTTISTSKSHTATTCDLSHAAGVFQMVKADFDVLAAEHGFSDFYTTVYPKHSRLVLSYVVEAFAKLSVKLSDLSPGDVVPKPEVLKRHCQLREVLYEVLRDGGLVDYNGQNYIRTTKPVDTVRSSLLLENIVKEFPQHAKEHTLLSLCGPELASIMTGTQDPLTILFGTKANRTILGDVYTTSPMYVIMSQILTRFLELTLSTASPGHGGKFRIIEIGAGTGATTKWVVDRLVKLNIPIEYTFTDISQSLVSAGKRKFSQYNCMKYMVMDIEKEPLADYQGRFDIVLAANCIHATRDLRNSLTNIGKLLQPRGFVSLVEFTGRMFWFDITFGLLEGWWLFNDGRSYVLASPDFWGGCMKTAGFSQVAWTGGSSRESEVVRVIIGCKQSV